MSKFYDCSSILGTPDKNGESPELFIVVSRGRGLGKTFSFTRHLLKRWEDDGGRFVLFCRYGKELGGVAEGMFKSMLATVKPGYWVEEKRRMSGTYSDVFLCHSEEEEREVKGEVEYENVTIREQMGYVIPLNSSDSIKKVSSTFSDAVHGYFDEFQPENAATYLSDEPERFKSVHTSIARGGGQSRRYFPVYMTSNAVSMTNPYFSAMRLWRQIQPETKRYRGDGFVYQRTESSEIAAVHDGAAMSRAMPGLASSTFNDGQWVQDDSSAVGRSKASWGPGDYVCTVMDGNKAYGLVMYHQSGILYMGHSVDKTFPVVFRLTLDGAANLPLLRRSGIGDIVRDAVISGSMRYQSQGAKAVAYSFMV